MERLDLDKDLRPLVKSYAKEMRVLMVDDNESDIEFYRILFGKYFQFHQKTFSKFYILQNFELL